MKFEKLSHNEVQFLTMHKVITMADGTQYLVVHFTRINKPIRTPRIVDKSLIYDIALRAVENEPTRFAHCIDEIAFLFQHQEVHVYERGRRNGKH